jgi:peptidyl-prolyl cis-trans isomerase C
MKGWFGTVLLAIGVSLFIVSCEHDEKPDEYVARVNDEYLTLEMIYGRLPETHGMNEAMVREYVNQWLTSEMLYQEARRRGLDRDERVLNPLSDIRRNLAINALLEDEIYTEASERVTEADVERYYEAHLEEFTTNVPLIDISYVLFEQRTAATAFRNAVVRGTEWEVALETILNDPEQTTGVIEVGERHYYHERDLYPPEIWRAARQLGAGGISFPVSTDQGFYIVRHHGTVQGGGTYPLSYVSNEIRERLVIERRQERYQEFLLDLRQRYPIDITFEKPDPVDTVMTE